jgi:hypothetical protein
MSRVSFVHQSVFSLHKSFLRSTWWGVFDTHKIKNPTWTKCKLQVFVSKRTSRLKISNFEDKNSNVRCVALCWVWTPNIRENSIVKIFAQKAAKYREMKTNWSFHGTLTRDYNPRVKTETCEGVSVVVVAAVVVVAVAVVAVAVVAVVVTTVTTIGPAKHSLALQSCLTSPCNSVSCWATTNKHLYNADRRDIKVSAPQTAATSTTHWRNQTVVTTQTACCKPLQCS